MKYLHELTKVIAILIFLCGCIAPVQAQFLKKLGKAAEKAAERTVERRVERETEEKTDQALDSIFERDSERGEKENPVSGSDRETGTDSNTEMDSEGRNAPKGGDSGSGDNKGNPSSETGISQPSSGDGTGDIPSLSVYSKFDFVPGDKVLLLDDFSKDFVGDFPSTMNTNGGGDLVQIEGSEGKWLRLLPGYDIYYIPDVSDLPEEFTMEFDVITEGVDNKTSSQSNLRIIVSENNTFDKAQNYGWAEYSFCQFASIGSTVENKVNGKREIRSIVKTDIRDAVLGKHHISVAVNQQRFRLWLNEQKLVDVPRLLPANVKMQGIKLHLRDIDTSKESVYISNLKIAEGGVDLRRQLLAEGKISTNAILFDTGSANLQPQSMGIIRQISQVLQQESGIKLKIVGHTDADGEDATNLELSKKRAGAVKNALVSVYGVSADRLLADGKGESEPIGDNTTADGKSQNRRVEFIKQ